MKNMKKHGKSIIIITHKLNEVMAISDRVAILRKGEYIGVVETSETDPDQLTEMMVGRPISLEIERPEVKRGGKRLRVIDLTCLSGDGVKALDNVSFDAYAGEILGIAGIAGSGQKELCETIAGLYPSVGGSVLYSESSEKGAVKERILGLSPDEIAKKGISMAFVPEDRLGMGLVAGMDMTDNVMLRSYKSNKGIFVDRKSPRDLAEKLIKELEIVTPGVETPVGRLSGGNVQKVLLGREIACQPSVLIVAYPVRGLDINASYRIYDLLNEQKKKGVAVVFIGEDLDVLMQLSDRIMVMCGGKVSGIVDPRKVTKEEMEGIPHYLIDVLEPQEDFNVVTFQTLALQAMSEIYSHGNIPIITGGTGFYIQALLYDIDFKENDEKNPIREELEQLAKDLGEKRRKSFMRNYHR